MIVTLTDVKNYMGITRITDDVVLFRILERADRQMKSECRREFESASRTEYYDGFATCELNVREAPITAITSIYDDCDIAFGSDTLIPATDYYYDANKGIIYLKYSVFTKGIKNIKVVYTAGYSAMTMPYDVKKAVINLACADYIESQGALNAIQAVDYVYKPDLLRKEAYKIINLYKRYV
jgi:hypothetical protein